MSKVKKNLDWREVVLRVIEDDGFRIILGISADDVFVISVEEDDN